MTRTSSLGLVAPRPFLLAGGGDGDGVHTLDLFRAARRSWPDEHGLDLLLHDHGHALPPRVMSEISEWLREPGRIHFPARSGVDDQ